MASPVVIPAIPETGLEQLIACPTCDALYRVVEPEAGERATCARCHRVLIAPMRGAIFRIIALALTVIVLLATAIFTPFLRIESHGLSNTTSIFDALLAFSRAKMMVLSVLVMAAIVFIPLMRMLLLIYVLVPLTLNRRPLPAARLAFRWSEEIRPWSMSEIFVLGVGVALVKVADLAHVELGTAFWLFAGLVVVNIAQDRYLCRWSIWGLLEDGGKDRDV